MIGTVQYVFLEVPRFTGVTVANGGIAHWDIIGGMIPGLGMFDTEFDIRNHLVDRPGSPELFFENKGRHRALAGVEKANLTYKSTADFLADPAPVTDWIFQGVICP